jgi:hypothetical protein
VINLKTARTTQRENRLQGSPDDTPHQKRIGFVLGRLLEFGIEALALEVPPTLLALADEDIE